MIYIFGFVMLLIFKISFGYITNRDDLLLHLFCFDLELFSFFIETHFLFEISTLV